MTIPTSTFIPAGMLIDFDKYSKKYYYSHQYYYSRL